MKKQLFAVLLAAFFVNAHAQEYTPVSESGILFNPAQKDRLVVNASTQFDLGTEDFTLYSNVLLYASDQDNPTIFSNRANGNQGLRFGLKGGKLYLKIADNAGLINSNGLTISDGVCHSVAVRRTADMIEFFVDGLSTGSYSYPLKSINSSGQYWIGNDPLSPTTCAFTGFINEVAMWNTALSNYKIGNIYPEATEGTDEYLIALWEMNDGPGQYTYDAGPNGITARFGTSKNVNNTDPAWATADCNNTGELRTLVDQSLATDDETAALVLSPNPASQFTSIVTEEHISGTLQVFNASGTLVKTIQEYTSGANILLNEELPAGIYQVIFKTEEETYATKLSILK